MAYKYKQQSQLTRVLCTVAFVVFTFCYLLFYQADVMVVAQHIASGGQTHYVPWVGALLITLVLKLLQVGVNMIFALYRRTHALTYLPSMLVLAFITMTQVKHGDNKPEQKKNKLEYLDVDD